jgi:hypothetical protein
MRRIVTEQATNVKEKATSGADRLPALPNAPLLALALPNTTKIDNAAAWWTQAFAALDAVRHVMRSSTQARGNIRMARSWKDMTTEEKLDWLRHEAQSTRQAIDGISARLDEVGGVVVELEKQIRALQAGIGRQKGPPSRIIKLEARN